MKWVELWRMSNVYGWTSRQIGRHYENSLD
jgi:hypothetical protein